jgi:DNA polymerase-3 subunit epsilon
MREIVFDTETTGVDPATGDRMVEIGCIELVNRIPTGRTFHAYFNPGRPMPAEAERIHGLGDAFLAEQRAFHHHVAELIAFLGDCPLVAHNAQFDFGFLNHELRLCDHPLVAMDRMVDTLALARKRHPGAKHSLDALCSRYGIDRSHRVLHGALLDAELLAQVYVELTGGRQIGLGLMGEAAARAVAAGGAPVAGSGFQPTRRAYRTPRPHGPTPDELARHKAFVGTLSSPLWTQ